LSCSAPGSGAKQKTTADYFLGDRSVPWWAVAFSIVATETSTITFISIPGVAFARGGNFAFLQLVFGYLLGRIVISILFIPSYFRGELLTVYQLLDQRFGAKIKMVAASLFCCDAEHSPTVFVTANGDRARGRICRLSTRSQL
jgi:Na+/proline symporter